MSYILAEFAHGAKSLGLVVLVLLCALIIEAIRKQSEGGDGGEAAA